MKGSWDDLRIFLALARTGTIPAASIQAEVSEATVRRRLARLETGIKAHLFEAHHGLHSLTGDGELLRQRAETLEADLEDMWARLSNGDGKVNGLVRVGAPDGLSVLVLSPRFALMQRQYPELKIDLLTLSRDADLNRKEVDVAVMTQLPCGASNHRVRHIRRMPLTLYASARYLAENAPIGCPADLRGHRWVGYSADIGYGITLRDTLSQLGFPVDFSFSSGNILAQAEAIGHDCGIGLLPDFVARNYGDLVPILQSSMSIPIDYWIIIRDKISSQTRVRILVNDIVDSILNI